MLVAERSAREAELAAERGRRAQLAGKRDRLEARDATLEAEVDRLEPRAERLDHIISVLRRAQFGRRSECIADDHIELALEDVETGFGVEDAEVETSRPVLRAGATRGYLPKHLPREEIVIAPECCDCPCCGSDLRVIGEDVSERLDKIPGGRTKTGYLCPIARDDQPWCGGDPPAVAHLYALGRGKEYAVRHLAGFTGTLQVSGYAASDALSDGERIGGPVTLALCGSHFRRRFYDIAKDGNAPIASEALQRIGALYEIEAEIRGCASDGPSGRPVQAP